MFSDKTYKDRRNKLKELVGSGIIFLPGNNDSSRNYPAEVYKFRQDSNFLYYFGLDFQGLAGVIDIDNDKEILFGDDRPLDDVVWMGPDESIADKAAAVGVKDIMTSDKLAGYLKDVQKSGRKIHYLPQYRNDLLIKFDEMLGIKPSENKAGVSQELIDAIVSMRSIKSDEEIAQIEEALGISLQMNLLAMKHTRPGMIEREIYGPVEGMALAMGNGVSFPVILSVHGHILHNPYHENVMNDGQLVVMDSGAESELHYASDITRSFPVNGKFSDKQKNIYQIVLDSQLKAIEMIKPGLEFRECHIAAARVIAAGLKDIGIMKGDTNEAVDKGAHALFFPHGLGHMMGLDVHDMEGLGENNVGYDESIQRSDQFGLAYLRFAKQMEPGHVLTVEPGLYFIPQLISNWKNGNKHAEFINYDKVEEYIDFGGVRIEDDILVTEDGCRILGQPIPKTIEEVEEACKI